MCGPTTAVKRPRFGGLNRGEEDEVDLTLKRKKLRILPIRTAACISHPSYRHPHHPHHPPHNPTPVDSLVVLPPEPPTLTPAESDVKRPLDAAFSSSNRADLPSIMTGDDRWHQEDDDDQAPGLHDHHDRDRDSDMLDSIPIDPSTATGAGPVSLDIISQRIPTPRYGTFFPSASTAMASSRPTTERVEASIVRAMGLSSLNRILPSPIDESDGTGITSHHISPMDRHDFDDDHDHDHDVSMTLGSLPPFPRPDPISTTKLWPPESVRTRSMATARTGKPMLVMGYRADCDKCQSRVPGHYSHIVRSA